MKVLHINQSDTSGGAAIAAMRLHKVMRSQGIDSYFLCYENNIRDDKTVISFSRNDFLINKIKNFIPTHSFKKKLSNTKGYFSNINIGVDIFKIVNLSDFDVIYLHWINNSFINFSQLERILKLGKPVYWFMHDMFPITAGCHYSFECNKYENTCKNCLYMKKSGKNDFASLQFRKKMKLFAKFSNLNFVAPSKWLAECAKNSSLTKNHKVFHIPNVLTTNSFYPIDKKIAKKIVNIDENKKLILFGAQGALNNPYKGFDYLVKALNILATDNQINEEEIQLLIFGSSYNEQIKQLLPFDTRFIGFVHDEITLNLLYNAADVFCIPSLAENFANTILEAVHCQTPIVGFDIGGISDVVNGKTGYLAKAKDEKDFANGIKCALFGDNNFNFDYIEVVKPENIINLHKQMWEKK